jgi:hypothetical protein
MKTKYKLVKTKTYGYQIMETTNKKWSYYELTEDDIQLILERRIKLFQQISNDPDVYTKDNS